MEQKDAAGIAVVEMYLDYLACEIANVINILQPEVIRFFGRGISKQGDTLLLPDSSERPCWERHFCDRINTREVNFWLMQNREKYDNVLNI